MTDTDLKKELHVVQTGNTEEKYDLFYQTNKLSYCLIMRTRLKERKAIISLRKIKVKEGIEESWVKKRINNYLQYLNGSR